MNFSSVCKHPKCFRSFKGLQGLRIHLGISRKCTEWYEKFANRSRKAPQPTSTTSTPIPIAQPSTSTENDYPWTADPYVKPHANGELHNPSGIDLPWSSSIPLENHFGIPRLAPPRSPPLPAVPPSATIGLDDECVHSDPFDETFLQIDDLDGNDTPTPQDTHKIEVFPGAGRIYGKGLSLLDQIKEERKDEEKEFGPYYPFTNKDDFEVAAWLSNSGTSMANIDKFLKLPFVKQSDKVSFSSAQELHTKIARLPKPPAWKSRTVKVPGGRTVAPLKLFYRDGLELFKFLFANPVFADHQNFVPQTVWADYENDIKIFDEPPTGSLMWDVQSKVGEGETLGLVIFGSDKTHLTNTTGDKKDHCVYMSCGNIGKDIRTKMSSRCWVKVAQIPVAHFEGASKERHGILCQRLYHICMDIVSETLKQCSHTPILMPDARGDLRLVRTILLAHIADHPEQQLIACAAGDASPISTARHNDLGLDTIQSLRTREETLALIQKVVTTQRVNPLSISVYITAARKLGLNGVHKPYWEGWKFADPSKFLTPDALHQWHRFFWDHPMKWARMLIGDVEINRRYMALQKHVGRRHFNKGFTSFSQHTGREFRELQASFIAVISGHSAITPGIMRAFRAIMDFIYIGQFETHTTTTIRQLEAALVRFHLEKHHLSNAGVRDGPRRLGLFNIKKVELMHHVTRFIFLVGSIPQFSTEQTERLHILMSKIPYWATNHKDYEEQMCRYLDREEKLVLFEMYLCWRVMSRATTHTGAPAELTCVRVDDGSRESDVALRPEDFSAFASLFLPIPVKSLFEDPSNNIPPNETTAFSLTTRITRREATVEFISSVYELPKLASLLQRRSILHLDNEYRRVRPTVQLVHCWDRVRLQLRSQDNNNVVLQPVTVMARPPTADVPFGLYNFVLVKSMMHGEAGLIRGHFVAQLRLIFQPLYASEYWHQPEILAYVEPLEVIEPTRKARGVSGCMVNADSKLIHVRRCLEVDGSKRGLIINLTDIWSPIDLVPNFRDGCPPEWTTDTAVDFADEFIVNSFYSKQIYISLR